MGMGSTIKDIAARTGLGIATISKYLNGGNVLPENKAAIDRAVKELNYKVNEFARGLKTSKSKTIGVVIPEFNNSFVTTIITEIEDILRQENYAVVVCDCRTNSQREGELVEFLLGKQVDGIINMPIGRSGANLKPALDNGIPVVLFDRTIPALKNKVDSVLIDNAAISKDAVSHLIKKGHRRIGIVVGPKGVYTADNRLRGYREALSEQDIKIESGYVARCEYSLESGYQGTKKILEKNNDITALYVTNYEMMIGAIIAIGEAGLKIPGDLSLIGFDNMDWAQVVTPRLTIVAQPMKQIGGQIASLMLESLTGEDGKAARTIILSATLNEGDSVADLNKKN